MYDVSDTFLSNVFFSSDGLCKISCRVKCLSYFFFFSVWLSIVVVSLILGRKLGFNPLVHFLMFSFYKLFYGGLNLQ